MVIAHIHLEGMRQHTQSFHKSASVSQCIYYYFKVSVFTWFLSMLASGYSILMPSFWALLLVFVCFVKFWCVGFLLSCILFYYFLLKSCFFLIYLHFIYILQFSLSPLPGPSFPGLSDFSQSLCPVLHLNELG